MNPKISAAETLFSLEDWADFARHVARPESCAMMQRHLDDPLRGLHDAAPAAWLRSTPSPRRTRQYEPPASTVRLALALFPSRPKPATRLMRALETVQLLFDSHLAPAIAGVRGGPARPRQLLFASSDRIIDLQVMPVARARPRTVLIGQITAPPAVTQCFEGLPVLLRQGTKQSRQHVDDPFR